MFQVKQMSQRFDPIPPIFHSEETEQPFERCIDCGCDLLHADGHYMIHKTFVRNEAVFEFAICQVCAEALQQETSAETRTAQMDFVRTRADFSGRWLFMLSADDFEPDDWIASCLTCDKARTECHRFTLAGQCTGDNIVLAQTPCMLCDDCEVEIAELTSQTTRDRLQRFVDDHFDGPPGLELDSPFTQPLLI